MVRVSVLGSVNLDSVYALGALPRPGETLLASELTVGPGGKGGNQAVAAARAGAQVQLIAALGDDAAAHQLRAHLQANGVGIDGLSTLPVPSGTAVILVDQHTAENLIVVAPGANAHLTLDSQRVRDLVADCDVLLIQLEIPVSTALAAARQAKSAGATVMLNASPRGTDAAALAQLAREVDVVVVNETEATDWRWPVPHLVTTRGARGATYVGTDGEFTVGSPPVEALDSSGAGDVFAGVLAAGWARDRRHALRRACAAGALATLTEGAGDCAPTAEAIEDVLALEPN
ncbi:ribokinase [[Mycobacterium] burgundiense]|uniref:Ribokinase n=1 Tax=[Mycobacterium] burgundiense TaxID=3064286 RepID=A0ABM9LKH3_9MYCO|nr:ribokinase [Mycolicibacterium sp. MU0053]CAJ1500622.1 ribokinase [Mycolicibacterium sp. MU0053]